MDTPTVVPFSSHLSAPLPRDGFGAGAAGAASAERELARLRARVRELSAQLVRAQEAACRHVARELHDGVGAELTATRFALAGVETWLPAEAPAQCSAALAVAHRSLDAVCTATRQAVAELHAPTLEAGIVGALAQWTGEFAARTQLRTSFACAADLRLTRLPADAALAVFRVAQEALNNIAKHARAECADVRIETSRRHLTLIVSDDGVGMSRNMHRTSGHFGLIGMKARCAAFDGTLRVTARRGEQPGSSQTRRDEPQGKGARESEREGGHKAGGVGTLVRARFAWDALLADVQPGRPRALQS